MECGGQCLLTASCSAFHFSDQNSCQLYDATYLYKDKTDNPGTSVYMQDDLWNQRGNNMIIRRLHRLIKTKER